MRESGDDSTEAKVNLAFQQSEDIDSKTEPFWRLKFR